MPIYRKYREQRTRLETTKGTQSARSRPRGTLHDKYIARKTTGDAGSLFKDRLKALVNFSVWPLFRCWFK